MTDIIPVKPLFSGADVTALGEFVAGDAIPIAHGGTGANTVQDAQAALGIVSATSTETLTNKTISGADNTLLAIGNSSLTNSSITINGNAVSLGGSTTVSAATTNTLTIGTGLSGTSFNGSAATTIAIDSTVVTLTGTQTLTNKTISGASNTLSNIGNSSLTNSSVTIGGTAVSLGGSTSALANDITVNGLTVGKGAGSVASNTAVGYLAGYSNTTGGITALGANALRSNTTGADNVAVGYVAMYSNTTGAGNSGFGNNALYANTTGGSNTALGWNALQANTTAANNTAVGFSAGYSVTTGYNNTIIGRESGYYLTTGIHNVVIGDGAFSWNNGTANGTGNYNVAIGTQALCYNTTAGYNTVVGYQAGYSNQTGNASTFIGFRAGYSTDVAGSNTFVGKDAGYGVTTGYYNTFIGTGGSGGAGSAVTTGGRNTIIGAYNGNQGGLDIRTSNNNIVLSDGDGNPRAYWDSNGYATFPGLNTRFSGGKVVIRDDSIENASVDLDTAAVTINYYGYNGGYTRFRSLNIFDGKGGWLAKFDGQNNKLELPCGRITFPATQNASSNANTLDDYEEGTWTPGIGGGTITLSGSNAYNAEGSYTKIGDRVFFTITTGTNGAVNGTGNVTVSLPFSVYADAAVSITTTADNISYGVTNSAVSAAYAGGGTSSIYLRKASGTTTIPFTQADLYTGGGNGNRFIIAGSYRTTA